MTEKLPLHQLLPDLLSTQLLAADVYATFCKCSRAEERDLWLSMMLQELGHVRFVGMLLESDAAEVPAMELPVVRLDAMRELCARARTYAPESAFERTLWALRLEHAQIDFGVESLAATQVSANVDTPVYPGPLEEHYARLLSWARRYQAAREVAVQIARIEEHLPQLSRRQGPTT